VNIEDERDSKHQFASNSRDSHLENPTTLVESALSDPEKERSHNLIAVDDNSSSQDTSKDIYHHFATGIRSSSSASASLNLIESFLAPFLNNQITPGPEDKFVCAQSEDDMKLIQILRYIKSCDGALDLLWHFICEHAQLLIQQRTNTACDTVRPSCDDNQYWLGEGQKCSERTEILCSVKAPTESTRTGFTGSNTENEGLSDACSDANDNNVEDDKIQVVNTMSGCPLLPRNVYNCEDQMTVITGDVKGRDDLHLGAEKDIGDPSPMKAVASETQWGRHEEEQEKQMADQECPVWKILKKSECPFQWVPDVVINSIPCSKIRENMITHLTGKPMNIIQV
jgi:hypothetical protein